MEKVFVVDLGRLWTEKIIADSYTAGDTWVHLYDADSNKVASFKSFEVRKITIKERDLREDD